jgi:hypothetical protein
MPICKETEEIGQDFYSRESWKESFRRLSRDKNVRSIIKDRISRYRLGCQTILRNNVGSRDGGGRRNGIYWVGGYTQWPPVRRRRAITGHFQL